MLFSEIYSSYFNMVATVLSEATQHTLTGSRLNDIVLEKAFAESMLTIPASLKGKWPLLKPDLSAPIHHEPSMPLTTLQKRWLKTLLQDRRIALFAPETTGLEDVEPLFNMDDVVWFDQYLDGDPYGDEHYIAVFQNILTAIKGHYRVRLSYSGHTGAQHRTLCIPYRLPYRRKKDWPKECLLVSFGLPAQEKSPRSAASVEAYPGRWTHHVLVERPENLDAELRGWLDGAYGFSMVK